jgi:hypothetical protein
MTAMGRYATQVGIDMAIDTGMNLATGNLTLENFGTSLAMSALIGRVATHPRVAGVSQRMTSRGFGAGYDAGAHVRARATGVGGPGSQGVINSTDRADHINKGEPVGADSPYAYTPAEVQAGGITQQRWKFGAGGHNADEFRARIAAEGGALPDYRIRTTAKDPITGVAIDEATRYRMEMAPGGAGPRRVMTLGPVQVPIEQTSPKSMFPTSMKRAHIEAAGKRAVELALGGAPNTTHTPPPAAGQNGLFSAIVTTPEGHPIVVEGYYKILPSGEIRIETMYPVADRDAGTIPVVPGSRVTVPGAATQGEYGYGE